MPTEFVLIPLAFFVVAHHDGSLGSSFLFVSLTWSSASGAGPKFNFTLKEKLTWQITNHNP
jgi:hypothetical protein